MRYIILLQKLKSLLSRTKTEFGDLQSQLQTDMKLLGMNLFVLSYMYNYGYTQISRTCNICKYDDQCLCFLLKIKALNISKPFLLFENFYIVLKNNNVSFLHMDQRVRCRRCLRQPLVTIRLLKRTRTCITRCRF